MENVLYLPRKFLPCHRHAALATIQRNCIYQMPKLVAIEDFLQKKK